MITAADLNKYDKQMTVGELLSAIRSDEEKQKNEDRNNKENIKNWFDGFVGKCISINHNDSAFTVFKVTKPFELEKLCTKFPVLYNVYDGARYSDSQSNCLHVEKEVNSEINKLWMNCPFDTETRYFGKPCKMKVITEEEYNKIVALYDSLKTQITDLKIILK